MQFIRGCVIFAKIKYIFRISSGTTPKSDNLEYWDGDIPWVTPADYKTENEYIYHGRKFLSKAGLEAANLQLLPVNSIVLSKRAPIGAVAITAAELTINQGCIAGIPIDDCSVRYYYFILSICTEQLNLLGSGTTFKELSAQDFGNFIVPTPDVAVQERIADYLDRKCSQIDAIIARQQEVIEKLKAYKLSVITEAVTKGLNPHVPMKDSGVEWIGEIPQCWSGKRLADLCDRGITYGIVKLGDEDESGTKVLRCSDVNPGYIDESNIRTVTSSLSKEYNRTILRGEVVVNVRGTLGGCAIVPEHMRGYNIAREVAMVSVTKANPQFVMYNILSNAFQSYQQYSLRGVIYTGLNISLICIFPTSFYDLLSSTKNIVLF